MNAVCIDIPHLISTLLMKIFNFKLSECIRLIENYIEIIGQAEILNLQLLFVMRIYKLVKVLKREEVSHFSGEGEELKYNNLINY